MEMVEREAHQAVEVQAEAIIPAHNMEALGVEAR